MLFARLTSLLLPPSSQCNVSSLSFPCPGHSLGYSPSPYWLLGCPKKRDCFFPFIFPYGLRLRAVSSAFLFSFFCPRKRLTVHLVFPLCPFFLSIGMVFPILPSYFSTLSFLPPPPLRLSDCFSKPFLPPTERLSESLFHLLPASQVKLPE